jgi:hypothetical protein
LFSKSVSPIKSSDSLLSINLSLSLDTSNISGIFPYGSSSKIINSSKVVASKATIFMPVNSQIVLLTYVYFSSWFSIEILLMKFEPLIFFKMRCSVKVQISSYSLIKSLSFVLSLTAFQFSRVASCSLVQNMYVF